MNISNDHVQCQNCIHLRKTEYALALHSHHQNWECKLQGTLMQYEDTVSYKICARFEPKV